MQKSYAAPRNEVRSEGMSENTETAKKSFVETAKDYKAEFDKISWPNREELIKKTLTVIVTSLLIGFIVYLIDSAFGIGYSLILNLLS